jgi:foldase protein PrsA
MAKRKHKSKQQLKSVTFTIILTVIVIAIFAYLINQETDLDNKGIAATVNGEKITNDELEMEYSKLPEQYKEVVTKEDLLNQMIDAKLLLQEAKAEGISVSDEEIEEQITILKQQFPTEEMFEQILAQQNLTLEDIISQLKEQLVINKLLNQTVLSQIQPTDEEILDYYKENQEQFTAQQGEIRAAHILLETKEDAEEVVSELRQGNDFGELALERSIDPSVAINKGDLGFFSKDTMVKEFEDAAFALKVGEFSPIVESQFGFHIIKRLTNVIPFNEAKESISELLLRDSQTEVIQAYLVELRDKAEIIKGGQELPSSEDTEENTAIKNEFKENSDEICTEEEKLVIRVYTSSNCDKCAEVKPSLEAALDNYDVVLYEWELDTGDNLATSDKETGLTKSELDILKRYNPKGALPTYVFGCKYVRTGNAFETVDLNKEQEAFEEILAELT